MAASRVCAEPGCPKLIPKTQRRCKAHESARDKARGTKAQRGYGAAHQATRRAWQARITQAPTPCARCGKPITSNDEWHLDHDDEDRTKYIGPSHAACNTSAGGRRAHQ